MDRVPAPEVFSSGNQYQHAASVLSETDGCLWVAAVNAALSIEIYLKSFLITDHQVSGYEKHKKVKRGHDLVELYYQISPEDKAALSAKLPQLNLESKLERYKDVFKDARYMFEPVDVPSIGSEIILLSKALKNAIELIISERYPVKRPPHIQEAVERALSKR